VQSTIAAGGHESCAVVADGGRVLCWGESVSTVMVPPAAQADQVSVSLLNSNTHRGYDEALACSYSARSAICWGRGLNATSARVLGETTISSVALAAQELNMGQQYIDYGTQCYDMLTPACAIADGGVQCVLRRCNSKHGWCRFDDAPT
jgi:hypothetical protein